VVTKALRDWLDTVANIRVHGTTQRIVTEAFAAEQPELQRLPAHRFDAVLKLERRVSHDGFVAIGGNYYSVPDRTRRIVERLDAVDLALLDPSEGRIEHLERARHLQSNQALADIRLHARADVGAGAGASTAKLIRPELRSVEDAEQRHAIFKDAIGNDVRRAGDDQLTRPGNAPGTPAVRKVSKSPDALVKPKVDLDSGPRIVGFDIVVDVLAIGDRERVPLEFHATLAELRQRRFPTCCKTGLDFLMRNSGSIVIERFLHLTPEPSIISPGIGKQLERDRAFAGGSGQHDPHHV
jgi:hypothetical protein